MYEWAKCGAGALARECQPQANQLNLQNGRTAFFQPPGISRGGGAHSTKKQRHGIKPCLINPGRAILLFLVVFLHGLNSAIMRGLCLGVFHGLFGFGSFFGASLGALFLLLVKDLFAA